MKWLLLLHQLPTTPNALRVKIWRRLHQVGAVAVKQSVYALPFGEHAREDLSWILKEIISGGGDGSICEASFLEGLTDIQIIDLFHAARGADYEKLIEEANQIHLKWSLGQSDPADPASKAKVPLAKLRRQLEQIGAIDFFQSPQREAAAAALRQLGEMLAMDQGFTGPAAVKGLDHLKGKTWVTRQNLFVDRLACGWLIRRFVDSGAVFKFVAGSRYRPEQGELCFDMFEGDFTHEGDRCTFEVMLERFEIYDSGLAALAEVVHDIDLKDNKYGRSQTDGFNALLTGMVASHTEDTQRLVEGYRLFESLYSFFRLHENQQQQSTPQLRQ